jgi:hypothetical protein
MDMDMNPYCNHPSVGALYPYGRSLHTGTPHCPGPEHPLWIKRTPGEVRLSGSPERKTVRIPNSDAMAALLEALPNWTGSLEEGIAHLAEQRKSTFDGLTHEVLKLLEGALPGFSGLTVDAVKLLIQQRDDSQQALRVKDAYIKDLDNNAVEVTMTLHGVLPNWRGSVLDGIKLLVQQRDDARNDAHRLHKDKMALWHVGERAKDFIAAHKAVLASIRKAGTVGYDFLLDAQQDALKALKKVVEVCPYPSCGIERPHHHYRPPYQKVPEIHFPGEAPTEGCEGCKVAEAVPERIEPERAEKTPVPFRIDDGTFYFESYVNKQMMWSTKNFGPGPRTSGILEHIAKEMLEIAAEPLDLEEWIDVVILALDGAWRTGANAEAIVAMLEQKQKKNFSRRFPDWRTAPPGKAIEHIRDGESTKEFLSKQEGYRPPYSEPAGAPVMRVPLALSDDAGLYFRQDEPDTTGDTFSGPGRQSPLCTKPPPGWYCTRDVGHEGPCAALPQPGSFDPPGGATGEAGGGK